MKEWNELTEILCLAYAKDLSGESKKLTRVVDCEIKSMRPIFKTEILIYQSKANLDGKILFGKITRHLDPEIRKCW